MITLDETEHYHSAVSDYTLRAVALLFGKETADKLLYRGNAHARLDSSRIRDVRSVWSAAYHTDIVMHLLDPNDAEESEDKTPVAQVSALANSG